LRAAYLDTHIAVFLHDGKLERLTKAAKREIEACDLLISPMVLFELEYLYKRDKINIPAKQMYDTIHTDFGVTLCRLAFARIVEEAIGLNWTTDPFDRLIVGHAKANLESPLITKDESIRENYANSVW
jgi:PIN domain nuclease of toxin-antitoxin system